MKKIILNNENNPYYSDFLKLYDSSFPEYERRTHASLIETMKQKEFKQEIYVKDSTLLALASYWNFKDFVFFEYLAVDKNLRGSGIGSKILKEFLDNMSQKYCILEIEAPLDDISKKRLHFYKNLGFKETMFKTVQSYLPNNNGQLMDILTFPYSISLDEFNSFSKIHKNLILNPKILYLGNETNSVNY